MRTYATAGWRTRIINISAARNSFATSCFLTVLRPPAGASGWAKNGWWPCGTFASNGSPCGAQPRVRVMFALAEVSSRKTAVQAPTCPGTSSKTGACGPCRDDRARRRTASFLKLSRASWTIRQTVTSLVTMPRTADFPASWPLSFLLMASALATRVTSRCPRKPARRSAVRYLS